MGKNPEHGHQACVRGWRFCGRSTTKTPHGGSRAVFGGLVNTVAICRGCSQDLKEPPRASPIAFEPGHGAGERRWLASLAGVAGGRRRRSRKKIAVISIAGTKTRYTYKPRKQNSAPRAAVACASHHGRTQQRRHRRLTPTARAKSRLNDRTKRENRGGTRQRGRVERYAQTQPRTDHQTQRSSETHNTL